MVLSLCEFPCKGCARVCAICKFLFFSTNAISRLFRSLCCILMRLDTLASFFFTDACSDAKLTQHADEYSSPVNFNYMYSSLKYRLPG